MNRMDFRHVLLSGDKRIGGDGEDLVQDRAGLTHGCLAT